MVVTESPMKDSIVDGIAALNLSNAESAHVKLAAELLQRCYGLLAEVEEFESYLRDKKKETVVRIGNQFKNELHGEIKRIKNLPLDDENKSLLYLNCSNLPFHEALWSAAKRSSAITSLFRGDVVSTIDIIAQNDFEWIKVSTITERRMIFDLAKSGWVEGDSSDDEEDFESDGLLKTAFNLTQLAKSARVRYRNPTIRLVLPRIRMRECHKEVLKVLHKIQNLGVILETAEDIPEIPLLLSQARDRMIPDSHNGLSDTLNVDTTILLALVSDLSHDSVEPKDWHHRMIAHQIKMEREEPMLPSVLWPACGTRKLVCTREAAKRAVEIVETIATESERRRTALLLNIGVEVSNLSREQILQEFQQLSKYQVPSDWCLPIEIIDIDLEAIKSRLPLPVVEAMSQVLVGVNPSVFFFGLGSGYTTITSNRAVSKDIEKTIEKNRVAEEMGPDIWIAPQSRSLVGKEKERRMAIPEDAE